MILITILVAIFWGVIGSLLFSMFGLLPQVTLVMTQFTAAVTLFLGYAFAWDWFLPIHELVTLLLLEFTIDVVFWHWHAAKFLIGFIRGTRV